MCGAWVHKRFLCVTAVFVTAVFLCNVSARAQAVYGSIQGTVQDNTGAAVPGATVVITDVDKGTSVTLASDSAGEFTAQQLIPDHYNVKITAQGFKNFEQTNIQVFADSAPKVTAQLMVGGGGETVEVNADAVPQLKTDKADVSTIFNATEIESLPIPDHNFTNLQLLLPGAQELGWSHAASEDPQGSKQIQIDGQAFGGVNYTLDGTDNQDAILGIIVINPNSDSMSETKLTTQNFDAEFGKAVSSVITVQTKSGSNNFHGTLFDNRESNANLARDPFTQSAAAGLPAGLKSQFGGSIGGPIWKDHVFFFGDYQGVRQKVGTSADMTVPTQQVINSCLGTVTPVVNGVSTPGCDFSQYLTQGAGHILYNNTGATVNGVPNGSPWPGNVIPAALISPTAMKLFTLLKPYAPNVTGSPYTNNYAAGGTGVFNSNQWDVRGDWTLSQKIHTFGRFSRFTDILTGKTLFGAAGGAGFGIGGYGGTSNGANDSLALGMDYAISAKWLTEVRLGYFRYDIITSKYDQGNSNLPVLGENTSGGGFTITQQFGAPDFDVADIGISGNKAPGDSGGNNGQAAGAQYGAGLNVDRCNCPLKEKEDQFQFVNNWTRVLGTHEIKFGADIRYARNLRVPSDNDRTGVNNFGSGPTSNGTAGTGLGFATLAIGDVTAFNRYVGTANETNAKEFQPRDFFFGQDTWRVTPRLTLNYGLRYEFYAPERVNGTDNGALLNLSTGYINVAGAGSVPLNMGVAAPKFPFNPRMGVAYQVGSKTVIRGGYGRSFDLGVFGSEFGHVVTQNIPVLANQSINGTGGYTTYAFQLDNPASTQGGRASGLSVYSPVQPNSSGQIPITAVVPGTGGQTVGQFTNIKARPFTERLPTLDAWNVSAQRALGSTLSITVAYVGNKGTHTLSDGDGNNTNPNEAAIVLPAQYSLTGSALHYDPHGGTCVTGSPLYPCTGTATPIPASGATVNTTLLQRYVGGTLPACGSGPCNWTQGISFYGNDQDTHYNAIQITLNQQKWHGLSANLAYAYQHALSAQSSFATWNKAAVIGNDSQVRRNSFTGYAVYDLPFGKKGTFMTHDNAATEYVIGGWEISSIAIIQSGLPFTLGFTGCGNDVPGDAPCLVNGNASALKKAYSGTPGVSLVREFNQTTLGGAFTDPGLDNIGNVGRNTGWGPGFWKADLSLMKNFAIKERVTLQFRMDAYNAFNHINFGSPNGTIDSTNAGQISGGPFPDGSEPRQLQFTLRIQF